MKKMAGRTFLPQRITTASDIAPQRMWLQWFSKLFYIVTFL